MSFLLYTLLFFGLGIATYLYKYGWDIIPLFVCSMKIAVYCISKYQCLMSYLKKKTDFIDIKSVKPYGSKHKITYVMNDTTYIIISDTLTNDITKLNLTTADFITRNQATIYNSEKRIIQATINNEDVLDELHQYLGPLGDYHKFIHGQDYKLNDIWNHGTLTIMDIECNEIQYELEDYLT